MNDRLYRSRDDRMIAGVAGGLAEQLGIDPSIVRVGWVVLAIVTGGLFALIYVVMMVVVPEEPDGFGGWRTTPPPPPAPPGAPDATDAGARPAGAPGSAFTEPPPSTESPASTEPPASATDRPTEAVPPPSWGEQRREARATWRQERREARAARQDERAAWRAQRRESGGPILLGLLLVLLGGWFLARRYLPAADFDAFWPLAVVAIGVVLIVLSIRPGSSER